ncbi:MAG: DUF4830 domain-containing protein [Oscillospiraceae bacterium]|jgi:hypothetical protein
MFIVTAKINRGKVLAALLFAVVFLSGLFVLLLRPGLDHETFRTSATMDNNETRIEYLSQYGWEVNPKPLAEETILVPQDLETSCASYCALQRGQGFDLAQYAGKQIARYTYEIKNYPTGEAHVQANLLVYGGKVIGGDVCTTALDGWMHGLDMPETGPAGS